MSTAGIVVIGNEVLAGRVEEENARFLISRLRTIGVDLRRVLFIRDDVDAIARDVREMSGLHDYVFTSGGVGTTHDDVTMQGIADAFARPLEAHPALVGAVREHDSSLSAALSRLALVPRGAELIRVGSASFPLVRVENVYVFPGVPEFFRSKWRAVEARFATQPFVVHAFLLRVAEEQIADILAEVDRDFEDVEFGSYPRFDEADHKVKLTIQAKDPAHVEAARAALRSRLEDAWIVREERGS